MFKKLVTFVLLFVFAGISNAATSARVTQATGDQISFTKITLSSFTWTSLGVFSTGRGALTCVNADTSNQIWVSTAATAAIGVSGTFPIYSKQSVQFQNNSAVFGLADTGVTSSTVYCGRED